VFSEISQHPHQLNKSKITSQPSDRIAESEASICPENI